MFMLQVVRGARHLLFYLPWLALLGWLTSLAWFLCDDAFISFRYVRNLLEGHGLVFNPGEYVEGYSNFLWVLELAAIWGILGVRPEQAAPWLSVVCTATTIAAMLWWVGRMPGMRHRSLVGWMALGLLCSSATFAVWTSGGGLETRQFTFFIVLAVVCLGLYRDNRWGLLAASLSLAAAAYTRPEGPLLAVCCFGWFAVQRSRERRRLAGREFWSDCSYLIAPFALLVAAHYLFRYSYYGEWLPNTYYAKHVRPWYGSGFRYLVAAALETGLYLLLPLSWLALRARWQSQRDGTYGLALLCVVAHMAYALRIGGDHFEYRPLDFYWPLLAVPAAAGIVRLGAMIAGALRRMRAFVRGGDVIASPQTWALALFIPVLFYAGAMQGVLLFEGAAIRERILRLHIELNEKNAGWLLAAPGMPMLVAISNDLRRQSAQQLVGSRFTEHREFANMQIQSWKPYEKAERGVIPDDALMVIGSVGIPFYYVPDLKIIDAFGLTDATVARNPVSKPNHERVIAHDRRPPSGYIQQRGVNFFLYPPAFHAADALSRAHYAVKVAPDLWMPFNASDHQWVLERFADRDLAYKSPTDPAGNRFRLGDHRYIGEQFLGRFERGLDGWRVEGEAVTSRSEYDVYKGKRWNLSRVGPGLLTSYHPRQRDNATGKALSPEFSARAGQHLAFLLAGGSGHDVGLRLLADGEQVAVWRGRDHVRLDLIVYPLTAVADKRLQLELFDDSLDSWGHIMLDHVMLMRKDDTEFIEKTTEVIQSKEPIIRSNYDVYLTDNELLYVNQACNEEDIKAPFFLHLIPVDMDQLPVYRKEYNFDSLDFSFSKHGFMSGQTCIAVRQLPEYDIRQIETGQYIGEGRIWKGRVNKDDTEFIEKAPEIIQSKEPIIRSNYDVYLTDNKLLYVNQACNEEDTEAPFFLHLIPVDMDQLPVYRKEYNFDNLDFSFSEHGLMSEQTCIAVRQLPEYDIRQIETGQYIGEGRIWESRVNFEK